jgi:hypothetical protein
LLEASSRYQTQHFDPKQGKYGKILVPFQMIILQTNFFFFLELGKIGVG